MKSLFDAALADELRTRLEALRADSRRQWGKMDVAQMLTHLSLSLEMALGDLKPPRQLIGILIGRFVKPSIVNDKPMPRNSPTIKSAVVTESRSFPDEQARLRGLLHRFSVGGHAAMTSHPHQFFGRLTPEEWGVLQYKHINHHLEQFGA